MIDNTDKNVLMRCPICAYLEEVPQETLTMLRNLPPESDEDKILCPYCLNDMYRADSDRFKKDNESNPSDK